MLTEAEFAERVDGIFPPDRDDLTLHDRELRAELSDETARADRAEARAEKAEAERDALERAIGEWIDVRARIGVPATFADKNLRDALHSLRASRRAPNHHPARPEADRG